MFQITTVYPKFDLQTHFPRANIKQKITKFDIERSGPSIEIDSKQSRNELGIGGYDYLSKKIRDESFEKVLAAIKQIAWEGDDVVNRAGHFREEMIFADHAKMRMEAEIPELNIRSAPQTRPKIHFHFEQKIHWQPGGAEIIHFLQEPEIKWQLGYVQLDLRG